MPGKLIIYRGLPGSGKTTRAKKYCQDQIAVGNIKVFNIDRDILRTAVGLPLTPGAYESSVSFIQDKVITALLQDDWTVIESSTNLKTQTLKRLIRQAEKQGAAVEHVDCEMTVGECISNDLQRGAAGGHTVGPEVINRMFQGIKNGFAPFPDASFVIVEEPYVVPESGTNAWMCDLDGTLAFCGDRDIYDGSKAHLDIVNKSVLAAVLNALNAGQEVVFLSGRSSEYREITLQWLVDNISPQMSRQLIDDNLLMRAVDDKRPDTIVKLELFNKYIRNYYRIIGVWDDRPVVNRMWRRIGLDTHQIGNPDMEF